MSTATAAGSPAAGSAELRDVRQLGALALGFAVCLALIPIHLDEAFGLPAHPLLLHVPVIFDPILAIACLVLAARADWRRRYGLAWAAFALMCLAATVLTVGAGQAFIEDRPFVSGVLHDHKEAGETLRLLMIGLTAAIGLLVAADWRRMGRGVVIALTVAVAALAVGAGFFTVRTGHLGAKAAWGREEGGPPGGGGFPGGGAPGQGGGQFTPPGGG